MKAMATSQKTDKLPPVFQRMVSRVLTYRPPKNDDRRATRKRQRVESTG